MGFGVITLGQAGYIRRFVKDGHKLIVCTILQDPDEPWERYRPRVETHLNRLLDLGDEHKLIFGHYFVVSRAWAELIVIVPGDSTGLDALA